ncbi:hypothetical protein [Streptomyces scabiei]|uniref:Uncharacterized protein n=1 Tax=Streptomyces scabiei TaxID=1930 RepID=A0A100JQ62_STRSC|nr:hypothetical protein [Streptomyces scabiei]GAQ63628.1 hypothetical protein SsS58_04011 [Streptomyces scabiei]
MSTDPRRPLEGQQNAPTGPRAAQSAALPAAVGVPKGAARQGVPSSVRSERFRSDGARHTTPDPTPDRPGVRIYAPPVYRHHYDGFRWSTQLATTPTAAYACACGKTDTARGLQAVAALVDDYNLHRAQCPRPNQQEGRAAA